MKIVVTVLFLMSLQIVCAQDSTYKPYKKPIKPEGEGFWDKTYSGGDLMLAGSTGNLFFNVSPLLGYRPNNKSFSFGIGATYQFSKFTYYGAVYRFSLVGVRAFVRQEIGNLFFLHAEAENYFTKGQNVLTLKNEIITIPCANVFVGYKQKYSDYSYYYIMVGYEAIGDRKAQQYVYPLHPFIIKAGYILDIKGK